MTRHSVMSPELIGIISVGVALAGMMLWTDGRIDRLDRRLGKVERNQAVLLE